MITALTGAAGSLTARSTAAHRGPPTADRLDYAVDVGADVRLIVLDLARRAGGSGGLVVDGQAALLAEQLAAAGDAG